MNRKEDCRKNRQGNMQKEHTASGQEDRCCVFYICKKFLVTQNFTIINNGESVRHVR